jgi:hypothetical protein
LIDQNIDNESLDDLVDQNIDNESLDEMMNDVEPDLVHIPEIFQNLCNESNIALFPGCTNYMKISAIFKLYNLKAKNRWSDKNFTSLL